MTRGQTRRWSLNYPKIFQNKCLFCGKVIPQGNSVCAECKKKQNKFFK